MHRVVLLRRSGRETRERVQLKVRTAMSELSFGSSSSSSSSENSSSHSERSSIIQEGRAKLGAQGNEFFVREEFPLKQK